MTGYDSSQEQRFKSAKEALEAMIGAAEANPNSRTSNKVTFGVGEVPPGLSLDKAEEIFLQHGYAPGEDSEGGPTFSKRLT